MTIKTTRRGHAVERVGPRAQEQAGTAPPAGCLMVGIDPHRMEVVVNLDGDRNGIGHITFSPDQARSLAILLMTKANDIDGGDF